MNSSSTTKLWAVVWRLSVLFVLWGFLLSPVILLLQGAPGDVNTPDSTWSGVLIEAICCLSLLIACWGIARFADHRTLRSFGFRAEHIGHDSLIGWLIGLSMIAVCVLALLAGGWADIKPQGKLISAALLISFFAILINAATQEILVRGCILQTIQTYFGTWAAVLASSVIFAAIHAGVFHLADPLPPINLFIMGIVFARAYLWSGNLWLPIAMHAAWNYALGPVLGLTVSANNLTTGWHLIEVHAPNWIGGGSFGIEGGMVASAVCLAALLFFLLRGKHIWSS